MTSEVSKKRFTMPREIRIILSAGCLVFVFEYLVLPQFASARPAIHLLARLNPVIVILAILFEAAAEAGRPPGSIHGTAVRMPLTLNIPAGIPLEAGIYEWRVEVEGFEMATAVEAFVVIAPAQAQAPAG